MTGFDELGACHPLPLWGDEGAANDRTGKEGRSETGREGDAPSDSLRSSLPRIIWRSDISNAAGWRS